MPTTKKAAPKSVRAKKTNIRKRVPKKNTAGAGRMLVAKKTLPSRIAKLKIKDKTGDGALKQNKIEHKLLTIESLHAKKNPSLTSKLAKPRSSSKMPYGTFARHAKHGGQVAALALLSPYRFPVDTHKLAVATARYSGVFFVAVGAFFTVWLADISLGSQALQATVVTTDSSYSNTGNESGGSNSSTGSIDCTKADNYFNTYCETVVDQKPPADISVNNASELTGSVQIKINVPFADSVTLMAYDRTQTRTITLGNATKVSSDVWEMYWRTTDYDDGDYKLKALIKNGYGTYESVDDVYTTVANAVLTESVSSTAGETAEATTTDAAYGSTEDRSGETANTDTLVDARVSVTGSLNLTEFKMEVEARTAEKVKIYAQKQGSTNKSLLGYAYQENENLWKYRWLPASTDAGEYTITAYALRDGKEYKSNEVVVTVRGYTETEKETKTPTAPTTLITPAVTLVFEGSVPLSGARFVRIGVDGAQSVELYLKPKDALVQKYLGRANLVDSGLWTYAWDTKLTPNGEYSLFAVITNAYGTYSKESASFKVANPITTTYTESQQKTVSVIDSIPVLKTQNEEPRNTLTVEDSDEGFDPLSGFAEAIDEDLQRLAAALRSNDPDAVERANLRFEELKLQMRSSLESDPEKESRVGELIDTHVQEAIRRTEADVKRMEKVILERTGDNVIKDSDQDGISDYDEINIYSTDPFIADTDGDGFTDGAEILGGFDARDPSSEAVVAYESPKERGIIRDDLLKIEAVIPAAKNEGENETTPPVALITGKALPNSFVSLYIFSTPIVVTVKTDAEGNWTYRFDKEIEDGTHQVYVGVTDNAGKLVAKSSPFTFVKEAEAYSAVAATQTPPPAAPAERSIASSGMLYLVLSISVVAIGLVLILLGLYLDRRPRLYEVTGAQTAV